MNIYSVQSYRVLFDMGNPVDLHIGVEHQYECLLSEDEIIEEAIGYAEEVGIEVSKGDVFDIQIVDMQLSSKEHSTYGLFLDFLELLENGGRLDYEEYHKQYDVLINQLSQQLKLADKVRQEFDDAISFMQTFEFNPESFGDEGLLRLKRKEHLLK
ncbi:hypothetical protein [Leifsonia shinshuensis]|uniref:hypothetical protein n=1 Tax=Leifsonia shinshuensis TaxID=150026 RepID=UPI0035E9A0F0